MSGLGGVGYRKRLRLACYPAVPDSLAGRRCQARGAGLFHLAGARDRPRQAVEELRWGGNLSPVAQLHSTLSPSRWQPRPDLPRASRSRNHRFPALLGGRRRSAPGLLPQPLQLLSEPDPPREPGGRELVLGETPPPRLAEDFLSHSAHRFTVPAISVPSLVAPGFLPIHLSLFCTLEAGI